MTFYKSHCWHSAKKRRFWPNPRHLTAGHICVRPEPFPRETALERDAERLHLQIQRVARDAKESRGLALVAVRGGERGFDGAAFRFVVQGVEADRPGAGRGLACLG